jgi:hypothetical protein
MDDADEIRQAFKMVCKKCGSEDIALDIEQGIDYGGDTGYDSGHISVGCNTCRQNDVHIRM